MTSGRGCSTVGPVRSLLTRLRVDPVGVDRVLAASLTIFLLLETWLGGNAEGHRIAVTLGGTATTLAVAFRRRYPAAVGIGVALLGVLMQTVWPSAEVTYGIAWILNMYAFAVWTSTPTFALGLALYLTASFGAALQPFGSSSIESQVENTVPFVVVSTVVMLIVRQGIRARDRRVSVAERERELAAREAIVDERARIARELHDVIAHSVSMMVVQAGAERRTLNGEHEGTREVLGTIEQIGRSALTEMRRLVGMLRADADDPLAPQPGLDDLEMLVTQVREAGLPVALHVEGDRRQLPVGVELSAYRIVQEALTNAIKHAGEAHAEVRVRYGSDTLELEIVDDGTGAAAQASGGGHGLVGMRERVALYGGRLQTGRRPDGGFTVRVLLPIR
jgi:signal transduction histidine kinase